MPKVTIMWPLIDEKIMKSGLCSSCGGCVAICPVRNITIKTTGASMGTNCIECTSCDKICPVLDGYPGNELDTNLECHAAKSSFPGQDGGTVTGITVRLFECGLIDAVIGVTSDKEWNAKPIIVDNKEDVRKISGTKYTYTPLLPTFLEALDQGYEKILVVGTPCQVHSIALFRENFERYRKKVVGIIGIFCMESMVDGLLTKYLPSVGITPESVRKFDIEKGKFYVYTDKETHTRKIKEMGEWVRESCHHCEDFSSYHADLSVGSVGSDSGWNTVIVRTPTGKQIWDMTKDTLQVKEANIADVEKLYLFKRKPKVTEQAATV
jgi:coenzyme F420-reducing hydrogenase beta subunit